MIKRSFSKKRTVDSLMIIAISLSLMIFSSATSRAESGAGPLDEPDSYLIQLNDSPNGGKTAFITGTATPEGAMLKIDDLWATQPVKLVIMSENSDYDIKAELRRYHWEEPLRSGSTGESGFCGFSFTNQGDVFITLISPNGPVPVYLGVQVDDEDLAQLKPVLIPKETRNENL